MLSKGGYVLKQNTLFNLFVKYARVQSNENNSENEMLSKGTNAFRVQYFIPLDNFTISTS